MLPRTDTCVTTGVPDQIRTAIENLVRNTIRHTNEHTEVEITIAEHREALRLTPDNVAAHTNLGWSLYYGREA
jgi:signal transduction histidine kinase